MAKKNRKTRTSSRKAAYVTADANRQLRLIALALIGVVVIVIAWAVISDRPPEQAAGVSDNPTPAQVAPKQYAAAPPMLIDVDKEYYAQVKMAKGGEFTIELFPEKAPVTVNSFVFLAREGFFDGVTFHRVLEGFMAQTGDPTGTGGGGPGYRFANEDSNLRFDKAGMVAMANSGRDTNGSQFFITFGPTPHLDGGYTIFGQVVEGMEVVNGLTRRDPNQSPDYSGDVIESITIREN